MTNAAELLRLINNMIRFGTIDDVDHDTARVRVQSGEMLTNWLPWIAGRAGKTRDWDPPTIGEQCLILSPGGDPAAGIVLTGIYSDDYPAPSSDPNLTLRRYPDNAIYSYDHVAHHMSLTLPESGTLAITVPGGTTWHGSIEQIGDLVRQGSYEQSDGHMTHNGTSVDDTHVHSQGNDSDGNKQVDTDPPK